MKLVLFVGILLVAFASLSATPCPDRIDYTNGQSLKRGDRYYYSNGSTLLNGDNIYYPEGGHLKNAFGLFYPNGVNLQKSDRLYYPSGASLKNGDRIYYANGNYLKNGESFYYDNGNSARRNGKLYRPDGSETPFSLTLREKIDTFGSITAYVQKTSDTVEIDFRDLFVQSNGVRLNAIWNGQTFSEFEATLNTGVQGEDVFLIVRGNSVVCSLDGENPTPSQFEINAPAAQVRVRVQNGYDPARVRAAIEQALQSITP